jgi:predicted nucleic acid-binding protein
MNVYVDASTLIALGTVGELDLLHAFDGDIVVPERVRTEVTTQPAAENLRRFGPADERDHAELAEPSGVTVDDAAREQAKSVLDESEQNGDTAIVAGVLAHREAEVPVGVVSDDRRVRRVADGLGATVTGTVGVVVRNVADGRLDAEEAKGLVRRIDDNGLHMTGELREKAYALIDDAA